jgi:rod shape-determining protein MreD
MLIALSGAGALLLQTTLRHQLTRIPDLMFILCVYLGLHQKYGGGASGAFFLGYFLDSCSGAPVGVNAFAMSLVFAMVAATSRYLWPSNPLTIASMVCLGVVLKTGAFFLLSGLGQLTERAQIAVAHYLMWDAAVAVLLTPAVFALLYRDRRA